MEDEIEEHIDGIDGWHTCPYKTEIGYDYTLCDCEEDQVEQCMMEI